MLENLFEMKMFRSNLPIVNKYHYDGVQNHVQLTNIKQIVWRL